MTFLLSPGIKGLTNLQYSNTSIHFRLRNFSDPFVFAIQDKTSFVSLYSFRNVLFQFTFSIFVNPSESTIYIRNNQKIEEKKYQKFKEIVHYKNGLNPYSSYHISKWLCNLLLQFGYLT